MAVNKKKESQDLLNDLLQSEASVVFVSLSTVDGNSFAHASDHSDIAPERVAAMTSSLLSLSETLSKETLKGKCSYNAVSTEYGSIITVRVPTKDQLYALSLCADKSDNMAMAMRLAFDTADKLATIVG